MTANPVGAPIDYPPNTVMDNVSSATATGDTRIVTVFGHRHAWTTRFSAQIVRANGDTEEMYDSFNWLEMPTYNLDSVTTNPVLDIAAQVDGASSGLTVLHAGDKLQFECHVDTTAAHARTLGVPMPTSDLHFANEAFGAEMCILYLETTGPSLIERDAITVKTVNLARPCMNRVLTSGCVAMVAWAAGAACSSSSQSPASAGDADGRGGSERLRAAADHRGQR